MVAPKKMRQSVQSKQMKHQNDVNWRCSVVAIVNFEQISHFVNWRGSGVFIFNFEQIWHFFQLFPMM